MWALLLCIQTDAHARNMRFKSWPYYKDWVIIFGKDRATGESAKGHVEHATKRGSVSFPRHGIVQNQPC